MQRNEDRCVLDLCGQLDLATCPILDEQVDASIASAPQLVRIELADLEFMDSTGLRSLLRAVRLYADARIELELTPGSSQVQRLFELTDVLARLPFVD